MWHSLFHLLVRSANTSVGYFSTNILAVAVAVVAFLFPHVRVWVQEGRQVMVKRVLRDVGLGGALVIGVYACAFTCATVRIIYNDHQELIIENQHLVASNKDLSAALEWRKHNVSTTDAVFSNVIYLLQSFQVYRVYMKGAPCVIWITSPPDSMPLASTVAQFSNSVSGCFTFGPFPPGNPDLDEDVMDGMIHGVIALHAPRDDKAAGELEWRLGNQIQTRRSFKPLKTPKQRLYQSLHQYKESFIWLQFGTGVKWNSALLSGKK